MMQVPSPSDSRHLPDQMREIDRAMIETSTSTTDKDWSMHGQTERTV
jgi:hypothetical protein